MNKVEDFLSDFSKSSRMVYRTPINLFFKVIGKEEATYLDNPNTGNGILVIYVPESVDTPHINKDGRIYRRQSSGTDGESIAETDRKTVDSLYEKGKASKEYHDSYVGIKRQFSYLNLNHFDSIYYEVATILCPMPIRKLLYDLFEKKYHWCFTGSSVNSSVDIDCIYRKNENSR